MSDEFVFPDMTPELQAYFDYCNGTDALVKKTYPPYIAAVKVWEDAEKPDNELKEEKERLYKAHYGGLDEYRLKGEEMRQALGSLVKKYYNAKKKWHCRDASIVGDPQTETCGEYKLKITKHKTGGHTWNYSRGEVYRNNELITTVYRNYSAFPFAFVPNHPNGHSYLVCGEDYQGQTVVELDTGNRVDYLPGAAKQGAGFCWSSIHPSPSGINLAVSGCHWACPYEVMIIDFSDPLLPPWPELCRDSDNDEFCGWTDDNSCKIGRGYEFCPTLNKREHEMSIEDLEYIEGLAKEQGVEEDKMYEWRTDSIIWNRPTNLEIAKKYVNDVFGWRKKDGYKPLSDFVLMADKLIEKLSNEDLKTLQSDEQTYSLLMWARENSSDKL